MIWKCFNFTLLILVSLVYSKDLNVVISESLYGLLDDIKYTKILKGKYQINKHIAASMLTIYDVDLKTIEKPRKFITSKTPKNDTIITLEGVKVVADLSTRYLFANHTISVDFVFNIGFKVSFPYKKLEISDINMKFQEFHLFGFNNPVINKIWGIISNLIEKQDILNTEKDNINIALNKFLKDNHKLKLTNSTLKFSVKSIERIIDNRYVVDPKALNFMLFDINTRYNKYELDIKPGMPINIDKRAFKYDVCVYATKQYLMNMMSLNILPEIDNEILKLRVDIKDIELKKSHEPIIVFKVDAYVTPKKGKEALKRLTISLKLEDNGIDDIKFNISVDGMDFLMNLIYKKAGLQEKLNEFVEKQMTQLKSHIMSAFKSIFFSNIFPRRINIVVYDDMIMLALKIAQK